MNRWFLALPIHRKLVVIALLVMIPALMVATVGLTAIDLWRFRQSIASDAASLASVIAENTAVAVLFEDHDDAEQTLSAVRVREGVQRACVYLPDGRLFAGYARDPQRPCSAPGPHPADASQVTANAEVTRNGRVIGMVFIERDLGGFWPRLGTTLLVDAIVMVAIGLLAVVLADRLHRSVSAPIARLAMAAREIQVNTANPSLPDIESGVGEVGELARALSEMLRRLGEANEQLRRRESEREELLAREREASRLKDEFLAAVSHELRTPLSAIVGWSQTLTAGPASSEMLTQGLASIGRNARAQARLIEDLVDVSRIVTGKLTLRSAPVDLREVIAGATDQYRSAVRAKRQHLDVQTPPQRSPVYGDRDRLQQVVANLLSNAVKFTPENGRVAVGLREVGSAFEIEVRDSGAGIKPTFLPFVFDRFRQADGSLTREHGGLGLGLAIVKQLTEMHGGSVSAASDGLGAGAAFTVRLPALTDGSGGIHDTGALPMARPDALADVRVLVVDDNKDAAEMLGAALTAAGAAVRVVTSGLTAVDEWTREPGDVLLCDLAMPGVDGFEVLRRIRMGGVRADRPIRAIAVSAHATEDYVARSKAEGFARHVTKPFQVPELLRVISDVLRAPVERS